MSPVQDLLNRELIYPTDIYGVGKKNIRSTKEVYGYT